MRRLDQTEVLVVGAGPVGMFAALRLTASGIDVRLIDKASNTAGHSYACALHPRTLQLLDKVGVARDAIKLGNPIEKAAFYEGTLRRAELDFSKLPVEFPFLLVLEQKVLEDLLKQKLKEKVGLDVRWNHQLADLEIKNGAATATIEEMGMEGKGYSVPDFEMAVKKTVSARADFVVGADGQGSIVRQKLGIEYERAGKPQLFVVYEFESGATIPQEVRIVLDSNTVSVLWPLSQNKGRWGFQWPESEAPADFPQKDRTRFTIAGTPGPEDSRHHLLRLLDAHAPWFQEDIKSVGWAVDIQFEHRLARRFGRDQAWLSGDSAHQTGPIGMQSMNIGFREGADLAARLTRILREKGLPDLLESYNFERRLEWEQLFGRNGDPAASSTTGEWVRERRGRLPGCIPASGSELTLLLRQLGLEFEFSSRQGPGV